jgi:ribosomal protein S18 acetylase RimI-like enzyme
VQEFELTGFDPDHMKKMVNRMFGITGRVFLRLTKLLGKEPAKFLVAEASGRLVGTTVVSKQGRICYISTVMVHPDYRKKGIATGLMMQALDFVRKMKKKAVLHVLSTNDTAKNLYRKLGFEEFEDKSYFVGNVDAFARPTEAEDVQIRDFRRNDMDAVHNLIRSSEDPTRLRIFGIEKKDLRTPFYKRIARIYAEKRIVALHNNRIVGYAHATWTTPEEAGRISNLQVSPEMRSKGIEEMLIHAGVEEIKRAGARRILATVPSERPDLVAVMRRLGLERSLDLEGMTWSSEST